MSNISTKYLITADDGVPRCWWGSDPVDYRHYHDEEWGRPETNDFRLFEKICLEGFQSGLSWLTILRKRENFRDAFAHFDFHKLATFDQKNIENLLQNTGIVRHRGKIEATINNAHRALEVVDEYGSLAAYLWEWEPATVEPHIGKGGENSPCPSITKTSQALSKDLKKRGWKFFGPTTAYAFMQAMGLVNDHIKGCPCRDVASDLRHALIVPKPKKRIKPLPFFKKYSMKNPIIANNKPVKVDLIKGEEYYFCACGLSQNQPFCDGSHAGTDLEPKAFIAEESGDAYLCQCKQTSNSPFCDGTHKTI